MGGQTEDWYLFIESDWSGVMKSSRNPGCYSGGARLLQKLTFVGQDLVKLKICLSRRGSVVLARVNNWLSSLSRLLMNDFDRNYNHKFSSSPIHSSPWRREVSVAKKVFSIYLSISVVKQVLLIVFIEYRLYWLSTTSPNSPQQQPEWLTDWLTDEHKEWCCNIPAAKPSPTL